MQKLKIDVTKIPRDKIFVGKKGKYVDLVLHDNRDGTDDYGNDGFIAIDTTKEEREAGEKGVIIGNWKHVGTKPKAEQQRPAQRPATPTQQPKATDPDLDPPEDDIPF